MRRLSGILLVALSLAGCDNTGMSHHAMMHGPDLANNTPPSAKANSTAGFKTAQHYCSQCHEMPNPALKDSSAWQETIARMQGYMKSQGKQVPGNAELVEIIRYYEKASGQAG